ncbi:E3 ubiquitin-protein ligase RNF13 [Varanus komodoensis]|uniref:E3 ubiquitin-protein ligase RNF167-like n=1 Tax=Varanus komodoensis TaxID=61221 RepID=UPI001CF7DAC6|nr:E3 ubiquitin-protein ligase RNF167-like [Varanus komodoensis]KAF7236656.1 E3 ubiquitin-protein ligase RNF13 [Varanus komodoensis]
MWVSLLSPSLVAFSLLLKVVMAKPFVHLIYAHNSTCLDFEAVPACFGPPLPETGLTGYLVEAVPSNACYPIEVPPASNRTPSGFFVLIRRYDCPFGTKILHAQQAGYQAAIIHNIYSDLLVSMAIKMKETRQQVLIPSVFIGGTAAKLLRRQAHSEKGIQVTAKVPRGYYNPCWEGRDISVWDPARHYLSFWPGYCTQQVIIEFFQEFGVLILLGMCLSFLLFAGWRKWHQWNSSIRVKTFRRGDKNDSCVICMAEYEAGERLKILPCGHAYHSTCIDTWLLIQPRAGKTCPICKQKVNPNI